MKKQFKIYAEEITIQKIKHIAEQNRRKQSAETEIALEEYIKAYESAHGPINTGGGL
ncbi:MAG: hypothetical protein Q4C82_04600 [Eubacteriales bacterium]|nr:hypothetical protein [Eubacteriales bacterium]